MRRLGESQEKSPTSSTLAIAAAMVVHVLLFMAIRYEMQPQVQKGVAAPPVRDVALEIRFVEPAARPVTVTSEPAQSRSSAATRSLPPRKMVTATPAPETAGMPTLGLATHTGAEATDLPALHTADAAAATGAVPDYTPPQPTDSAGIMSHRAIVGYAKSRFEDAWAPRDENLVSQGLRRAQDAATIRKTVDFGHGVRMRCAIGPLGGGCGFGDAPSKAATKDGDARLSMAPARALTNDMSDASARPGEAACVAAYRVDARVLQGCSSDTPLRAMDAENAERARRIGQ